MSFSERMELLSEYYCNQFDYKKLLKMIEIFISLIRNMQLELGDINSIRITPSYEMKYTDYIPNSSSRIESFWINDYKTEEQMKECISMFVNAFNNLSDVEKEVFSKVIFQDEKESTIEIKNYYKTHFPKDITHIKKSAIIKFATYLRFHRMMDKVFK